MPRRAVCPRITCRSYDISPVGVTKKGSITKGVVGAAIGGPILGAAGFLYGKKVAAFRCNACGKVFTVKL